MAQFTDKKGNSWMIVLDTNAIETVRQMVKNRDGQEVDILAIVDAGDFGTLKKDIVALIDTVYTLCLPQIQEQFDEAGFDAENRLLYEALPDWKTATKLKKSMRWFASLLDGAAIERMTTAFLEAIVDFTQGQARKDVLATMYQKEQEIDRYAAEAIRQKAAVMTVRLIEKLPSQMEQAMERELEKLEATPGG